MGATGSDPRRRDDGVAGATPRSENAGDGPVPPITRRARGGCAVDAASLVVAGALLRLLLVPPLRLRVLRVPLLVGHRQRRGARAVSQPSPRPRPHPPRAMTTYHGSHRLSTIVALTPVSDDNLEKCPSGEGPVPRYRRYSRATSQGRSGKAKGDALSPTGVGVQLIWRRPVVAGQGPKSPPRRPETGRLRNVRWLRGTPAPGSRGPAAAPPAPRPRGPRAPPAA
jgi:hypothetical protein